MKLHEGLIIAALALGLAGTILAIHGLMVVYDDSSSAKIVGGDAYNYIIYATRGTAWVAAGAVAGLLSVTASVLAYIARV